MRKIRTPVCKRANLQTFDDLTDFFFREGHESNFHEQRTEWENIWIFLCKRANLLTFEDLANFFWNFYEKLELVKGKSVQAEATVFCGQLYQDAQIISWWNHLLR